jgi:hypothetical protein
MVTKALKIRQEVLKDDDSGTFLSTSILGSIFSDQGKYEAAEAMHRQALAGTRRCLGKSIRRC